MSALNENTIVAQAYIEKRETCRESSANSAALHLALKFASRARFRENSLLTTCCCRVSPHNSSSRWSTLTAEIHTGPDGFVLYPTLFLRSPITAQC